MSLIYSVFTIGCCFSTSLGCEISIMYIQGITNVLSFSKLNITNLKIAQILLFYFSI